MHQFHYVDIYSCSGDQTLKNCSNARPDLVHKMLGIAIEYFNQKYDLETAYSLAKTDCLQWCCQMWQKCFIALVPEHPDVVLRLGRAFPITDAAEHDSLAWAIVSSGPGFAWTVWCQLRRSGAGFFRLHRTRWRSRPWKQKKIWPTTLSLCRETMIFFKKIRVKQLK